MDKTRYSPADAILIGARYPGMSDGRVALAKSYECYEDQGRVSGLIDYINIRYLG